MNHRTTTTLLVVIAVATLLAAGIGIAIVRNNHSAFAHKNYDKFNKEDRSGRDGDQYLKCIVVGGGGISDNSCSNHDGATPTPIPTSPCNPSTVGGQPATPTSPQTTPPTCTALLPANPTPAQLAAFENDCLNIPGHGLKVNIRDQSAICEFPLTPPT